jgi:hypothetical protein
MEETIKPPEINTLSPFPRSTAPVDEFPEKGGILATVYPPAL